MKNYLPGINGLRALSVLMVIFSHVRIMCFNGFDVPFPLNIIFDGGFGVNVFFVISGFLITRLLLIEEVETKTISLKNFYFRRTLRIFPAYYFLLLVYFVLQLCSVLHFTTNSWLSSIFYYKYITGGDWESGHFWSLSVEEHFYLIWPALFLILKKGRKQIAFAVILFVIFLRLNSYRHFFNAGIMDNDLSLFKRADALMIGCLFALYEEQLRAFVSRYKKKVFLSPLLIILLMAFLNSDLLIRWNMGYNLHLGAILVPFGIGSSHGTITNLLIGLLVLVSIEGKGRWSAFLNIPIVNFIGVLSYSLYLWQQLFFSKNIGVFSYFPLNLLCIVVMALFSYYLIERPFVSFKNRYGHRTNEDKKKELTDPGYVTV